MLNTAIKIGALVVIGLAIKKVVTKPEPVKQNISEDELNVETTVSIEVTEKKVKQAMYIGIGIVLVALAIGCKYGFKLGYEHCVEEHTKNNDYNRETNYVVS